MEWEQRKWLAQGLRDMANIAAGAFLFGQFISGKPLNTKVILFGALVVIILYYIGYFLMKGGKDDK